MVAALLCFPVLLTRQCLSGSSSALSSRLTIMPFRAPAHADVNALVLRSKPTRVRDAAA